MIFIRESKHNIPICRSSLWKSAPFLLPVGRNYAFQDPHFWAKGAGHPSAVKIRSRHMGCPVKNDDFGGVPPPLRASCFLLRNLFRVTENTACWVPKHIMFRGLKNGSNITSRSRLFAGQSEEANRPFPKPTSGTKPIKKEGSQASYSKRPADWLTSVLTEALTDWSTDWLKSRSYCFAVSLLCWHTVLLFYWHTVLLALCFVVLRTYWFADTSWIHRTGATTRLRPLSTFLHRGRLGAAPTAEAR